MDEDSGYCKGCKRTLNEVAMWLYMSDVEKLHVLEELRKRTLPAQN